MRIGKGRLFLQYTSIVFPVLPTRWLGVRLETVTNLLTLFSAIIAVFLRDQLTAGTVGLVLTYALQITHSLNSLVRTSSDLETNIVAVERIDEYAQLEPEALWEIPEQKPPSYWPVHGNIESVRYTLDWLAPHSEFRLSLDSNICQLDTGITYNWSLTISISVSKQEKR